MKESHGKITEIEVPASKSQTIRAYLIATFAKDKSIIRHPLLSSDTKACIAACRKLGARITFNEDYTVSYVDSREALSSNEELEIDCQNSGTTEYLLLPLLASLNRRVKLYGDEQLNKRPVKPLADSLSELGAAVATANGLPPLTLKGPIKGGRTVIECKTSQYLSGLLLGLPLASGDSTVDCSLLYEKPYVRMTLAWLDKQRISYSISENLEHAELKGGQSYKGFDEYINGDFSSASFFFVMAAITGRAIRVKGLDKNDPQGDKAILDILERMGCTITWEGNAVTVQGPKELKGGEFDLNAIPDTLPVLSVAACFATSPVHLTNVPQARIKETDRIATMTANLRALGADIEEESDGMVINAKGYLNGGSVKGYGDHRIIMAMATASLKTRGELRLDDTSAVSVTFPTFFNLFNVIKGDH